jgi:sporulation integral membrane protein YtvI
VPEAGGCRPRGPAPPGAGRVSGARPLVWAGVALLALVVLVRGLPVLGPFLLGAVIAVLIEPLVAWLVRRGLPRPWAAGLCLCAAVGGGALLLAWAVAALAAELARLASRLPDLDRLGEQLGRTLAELSAGLPPVARTLLEAEIQRLYAEVGPAAGRAASAVQAWAFGDLPRQLLALGVACLSAYFLCRDRDAIAAWIATTLPAPLADRLRRVQAAVAGSARGFVGAELLLVTVTFAATALGLAAIGAPYVLLAAAGAALLDLLPVVGPSLIFLPWAGLLWVNRAVGAALGLLGVWAFAALTRWALTPHVLGRRVGLHPLLALFSLYAGLALFGVAGLFWGPLVAVVAQAALDRGR